VKEEKEGAIAVVDPFSTGATLAAAVCEKGYKCVRVLSIWDSPLSGMVDSRLKNLEFCATIQHDNTNPDKDDATDEVTAHHTVYD
jgi:hypothetical protein